MKIKVAKLENVISEKCVSKIHKVMSNVNNIKSCAQNNRSLREEAAIKSLWRGLNLNKLPCCVNHSEAAGNQKNERTA